jgi:hypothetical protein
MTKVDIPIVIDQPARLLTLQKNTGAPDLQVFDAAAINSAINRQMEALPEDKTVAAIVYVDQVGANVAIVGRVRQVPGELVWTVLGTRQWSGDWTASAALRWAI